MIKLLFILSFLFLSVTLNAYSKKIIFATYSTEDRALRMMKSLPKIIPNMNELSKQHDFKFKARASGKYFILVAEVFKDEKSLRAVYKVVKKNFSDAHISNYTPPQTNSKKIEKKIEKKVKQKEKVVVKKIEKVKEIKKEEAKKEELKKPTEIIKQDEQNKTKELNTTFQLVKTQPKVELVEVKKESLSTTTSNPVLMLVGFFREFFHWSYIVIILLIGVGVHYYSKYKRMDDVF